ncbi:hypothetical protein QJS10_CPA06g01985 [Acorus calamus]|uniref:Uncharacterized protein n=1 Tax=Acorus calamus TaxID=4465 RepID=A0AAV9ENC5_ACOCL|nr:hypothetical protein QJS10_CPA06g01985 [Acorus calamus]
MKGYNVYTAVTIPERRAISFPTCPLWNLAAQPRRPSLSIPPLFPSFPQLPSSYLTAFNGPLVNRGSSSWQLCSNLIGFKEAFRIGEGRGTTNAIPQWVSPERTHHSQPHLVWPFHPLPTRHTIRLRRLSLHHPAPKQSLRLVLVEDHRKYYYNNNHRLSLTVGRQVLNEGYSFGKSLSTQKIERLAAMGNPRNAINVVLTSADVTVDGFCMSRCGTHGASPPAKKGRFAYVWVGNSASQCPGQCAWPFHQPIYGPQSAPLVSPNGDVGVDGMVMNLASLLAGTVTNPFGDGYFQGPTEAPLEAASACPSMYGKNAYPGYAGDLLVDPTTGASYNANGELGRKYLLPALFDPTTSSCSTLV